MALIMVAFLLLGMAIPMNPALAQAVNRGTQGGVVTVQDVNQWNLITNEKNYGKRFPFARFHRDADRVVNGRSQAGGSLTVPDPAYKSVEVKCDFFSDKGSLGLKHLHYTQDQQQVSGELASQRDSAAAKGWVKCFGLPVSDTTLQIIDRENKQRLLELFFDPERWMWKETAIEQLKTVSTANSTGAAAETSFRAAFDTVKESLINVANERASVPTSGRGGGQQSYGEAIFIVQQMYKTFFLPVAILLLLPGAVMVQMKGMVTHLFLGGDEDSASPLTGIIRAIIAIFLIPATQLIVSYSIDVGNALAGAVSDPSRGWIQDGTVLSWASEQMFAPPIGNAANAVRIEGGGANTSEGDAAAGLGTGQAGENFGNQAVGQGLEQGGGGQGQGGGGSFSAILGVPPGNPAVGLLDSFFAFLFGRGPQAPGPLDAGAGQGKSAGQLEGQVVPENSLWLTAAMQAAFNTSAHVMSSALLILAQYQLVFMCYLFLLGPIAAALYAWPSGIGTLFNRVFSNWVDAVLVLALWRFWWCVILAIMTQRVVFLQPNAAAPAEMMVFNCFMALLLYIPFQPFNFHPGPMVTKVLDKAGKGGG